jgi:CBS domain-containing protein
MNVRDLLKGKTAGASVLTVTSDTSVHEAARVLMTHRVGSVMVVDRGRTVAGILTERDLVRGVFEKGDQCASLPVRKLMTADPVVCHEDDTVDKVIHVMSSRRFRHMLVVDKASQLIGVISIGDVLKSKMEEAEGKADDLEVMAGFAPERC